MKLSSFLIVLFCLCISGFANAQPEWDSIIQAGDDTGHDKGNSVTTDNEGNVYVTGSFESSTIQFGPTTLVNEASWTSDIFIVKYDPNGNVTWSMRLGGSGNEVANSITTDGEGNVYIAGYFQSEYFSFDRYYFYNASGEADIFFIKFDKDGKVLWAESSGGDDWDEATAIVADLDGNVYVTGNFYSPEIKFWWTTLKNSGSSEIFVVKIDKYWDIKYAVNAMGVGADEAFSIAADSEGNAYVTGSFSSKSLVFGDIFTNKTGEFDRDLFVAKLDNAGKALWVNSAGGSDWDESWGITLDESKNIYVTGYFQSPSISFGSNTLNNDHSPAGDLFIAKLDVNGNYAWAKSLGGDETERGMRVAANNTGVFVLGVFSSSTVSFSTRTLTNKGDFDLMVLKYDLSGNRAWAVSAGGNEFEYGHGISAGLNDELYITGYFYSSNLSFDSTTLSSSHLPDLFIAKMTDRPDHQISIEPSNFSGDICVFPNPSGSHLTINLPELKTQSQNVTFYDMSGRRVLSRHISQNGNKVNIDISTLPEGMYMMEISSGGNRALKKVSIVR